MTEYLFKLKKDGKTVGYLQISEEVDTLSTTDPMAVYIKKIGGEWRTYELDCGRPYKVIFDTAHPFVTKDKNGKDVFAGDKVRSKDGLREYRVTWDERRCRWWLWGIDKAWAVNEPAWKDYELIEDKDDE